jgi:hypothetical protein
MELIIREGQKLADQKKGGGSVSGLVWNNEKRAIDVEPAGTAESGYSGRIAKSRFKKYYFRNPNSSRLALKVAAPGKATARIKDYQGNAKMKKYSGGNLHPDAEFAHSLRDNVKEERTLLMNVKLMWSRLFRKSETQPDNIKQKVKPPKYDKREKGLWYD